MTDTAAAVVERRPWRAPTEFTQRLMTLARDVLHRDPAVQRAVARWRERLPEDDLVGQVEHGADALLASTSKEIEDILQKRRALDEHDRPPRQRPGGRYWRRLGLGLGGWLIVSYPVAVWQAWPAVSTTLGGGWTALIAVGALVAAVALGGACIMSVLGGDDGFGPVLTSLAGAAAVGYLVAVWRLWPATVDGPGRAWAWVIWVAAGLLAGALVLVLGTAGLGLTFDDLDLGGAKGARAVFGTIAAIVAAVVAWQVLRNLEAVPAHGAEAGGLLAGLVVGTGGLVFLILLTAPARAVLAVAAAWAVPKSGPVAMRRTLGWRRQWQLLDEERAAAEREWEAAARALLAVQLIEKITAMVSPGFATVLGPISADGLGQLRAGDRIVLTRSFERFRAQTETLIGGALGVAGPRGAGKSSLLEHYHAGRMPQSDGEQLSVFESVPVTFEPREYALYLYAVLCEKVMAFRRPPSVPVRRVARRSPVGGLGTTLAVAGVWVVAVLLGTSRWPGLHYTPPSWLSNAWLPLAVVGVVAVLLALMFRRAPDLTEVAAGDVHDLATLRRFAEQKLHSIRYQQRQVSGWSGKVRLPFGGERASTTSMEVERHPMAYPEVVNDLRGFLTVTATVLAREPGISRVPVVIVLDELDKMSAPERVQDFLNEVKALFSIEVPGCLFLVSISEDALARFERRGLPVRDALDSTFDAIVAIDYLELTDAEALLAGRVVGLPDPFIALCHTLSGGLPRELLRCTRAMVALPERRLRDVAEALVGAELRLKARALGTVIARRGLAEPYASDLMRFVNAHVTPSRDELLDAVANPPVPSPPAGRDDDLADVLHLQLEALSFLYYCATILQVFGDLREQAYRERESSFDTLASVRQLFAVNARLTWLTLNAFRDQWSLRTIPPPVSR